MRRLLTFTVSTTVLAVALAMPQTLPDVIVTHLSSTPKTVTVHLQNQGPGEGQGTVHLKVP